jgi:hypothetical protein
MDADVREAMAYKKMETSTDDKTKALDELLIAVGVSLCDCAWVLHAIHLCNDADNQ